MLEKYYIIDTYLNEFWKFLNYPRSLRGAVRFYMHPKKVILLFKLYNKIKKTNDIKFSLAFWDLFKSFYKMPNSVESLINFFQDDLTLMKYPTHLIVAKYLTCNYPNLDFEAIHDLQVLYIPQKDPIYNTKNITIILTLIFSLILRGSPRFLTTLGINLDKLYEYNIHYIIIGVMTLLGLMLILIVLQNYKAHKKRKFKLSCLKSCIILNKHSSKLKN